MARTRDERREAEGKERGEKEAWVCACLTAVWLPLSFSLSLFSSLCRLFLSWYFSVPLPGWLVSSRNKRRRGQWVPCQRLRPRLLRPVPRLLRNTIYDCRNRRIPAERAARSWLFGIADLAFGRSIGGKILRIVRPTWKIFRSFLRLSELTKTRCNCNQLRSR